MANIATMQVTLLADVRKLVDGFNKAENATKKFVANTKRLVAVAVGIAGFKSLTEAVLRTVEAIDMAGKTAAKLGITIEAFQELQFVASQSGIQMNQMETALQRLARRTAQAAMGTGEAVQAFKQLNLNAQSLNRLSADKQFEAIAKAMEAIANQNDRIALAQKFFDSEGVVLLQAMNDGMQGIVDKRREAQEIGLFSIEDAQRAAEFNDALDKLTKTATAAVRTIVTDNLEELITAINTLATMFNAVVKAANAFRGVSGLFGEPIGEAFAQAGRSASAEMVQNRVRARLLADLERRGVSREGTIGTPQQALGQAAVTNPAFIAKFRSQQAALAMDRARREQLISQRGAIYRQNLEASRSFLRTRREEFMQNRMEMRQRVFEQMRRLQERQLQEQQETRKALLRRSFQGDQQVRLSPSMGF